MRQSNGLELKPPNSDLDIYIEHKNHNTGSKRKSLKSILSIFLLFAWAFVYSCIYIIFPVLNNHGQTNFWAYTLAKQQWWSLFTNAEYVEIAETCIPGVSNNIYVFTYIAGLFTIPSITLICWASGVGSDNIVNILVVGGPITTTFIGYGYWLYYLSDNKLKNCEKTYTFIKESNKHNLYDMFSMVHDITRINECNEKSDNYLAWKNTMLKLTQQCNVCTMLSVNEDIINPVINENLPNNDLFTSLLTSVSIDFVMEDEDYFITNFCKEYKILPRFWNTQKVGWAGITSDNILLHFIYTFSFLLGWIICYFSLMVCFLFFCSIYICIHIL